MQFTSILLSLLSLLSLSFLATAAPVPAPGVPGAVAATVGVVCALQADKCQKVGDAVVDGVTDFGAAAGKPVVDSAREDGGLTAAIGESMTGVLGGTKH